MSYLNANLPNQGSYVGTSLRVGRVFSGGQYDQALNTKVSPPAYTNSNSPYGYSNGAPGVEISPNFTYVIQPNASNVVATGTTTGSGYLTVNQGFLLDQKTVYRMDCARNITVTRLSNVAGANVFVWGYDYGDVPMFEAIPVSGGSLTARGKKAFYTITNVYVSTADTWTIASGYAFGLPYYISDAGCVSPLVWNQTMYDNSTANLIVPGVTGVATATTGDVRGTIDLTGGGVTPIPNGAIYLYAYIYVQGADNNNTNVSLLYGVPQYNQALMPAT